MSGGHFDQEMLHVDNGVVPRSRIEDLTEAVELLESMNQPRAASNMRTLLRMAEMLNENDAFPHIPVLRKLDKYAAGDTSRQDVIDYIEEET